MDSTIAVKFMNDVDEQIRIQSFCELFGQGALRWLAVVLIIICMSFFFHSVPPRMKHSLRHFSSLLILCSFIIAFFLGFVTYSIGSHVGGSNPFLSNAPMAIIHAILMFAGQSDISAIKGDCVNSPLFMMLFNFSHFFAVVTSCAIILRHFGFHIISIIRLAYHKYFGTDKDHLYVMWGFNDAAFSLAKSLLEDDNRRHNCRVLVVRTNDEEEALETQMAITRLFRSISLKNRELDRLEMLDCLNVSSYTRLSKLDVDVTREDKWDILGGAMNLHCIPRLMKKTTRSVSFFLLNNSEESNCKALENLLHDKYIIDQSYKVSIYCHARRSQLTDVYNTREKYNPQRVRVHILDSAELSINYLKTKEYALPIDHLTVDPQKACVTTPFRARIIGYGETGQEALHFLYEFSALPREDGEQIHRRFDIVDQHTTKLETEFLYLHPALKHCTPTDQEVFFHQATISEKGFYEGIEKDILETQYFVISLNDDELNMNVATTLYDIIYRSPQRPSHRISIFVKTYDQDKLKWMKRIAKNKNSGDRNFACTIRIFGTTEQIFNYDMIIADTLLRKAQQYNKMYESVCNNNVTVARSASDIWIDSFGSIEKLIIKYQVKGKTCSNVEVAQEILRKTLQNITNALHISTKLRLLGVSPTDSTTLCHLDKLIRTRQPGHLDYYDITPDGNSALAVWNSRLFNCAKCEHLRWNASHIMLGYDTTPHFGDGKSDRTKVHDCIRPWDELDELTQSYDSCVVDTSIRICYSDLQNSEAAASSFCQ